MDAIIIGTIFELAAKALAKAGVSHVTNKVLSQDTKLSSDAIIKLAKSADDDNNFDDNYLKKFKKEIKFLLNNENKWNSIIAQLKPVDHRGIMFLGPSGSGKTTLVNAFVSGEVKASTLSTPGIQRKYPTICSEVICIRDTPGRRSHGDSSSTLIDECLDDPPRILCLVLANSYLQTVDDPHLQRGYNDKNQPIKFQTKDEYLQYTKKEEIDWLKLFLKKAKNKKPRHSVQHIVIVANKMDLWGEQHDEVKNYYINNSVIKELVSIFANSHQSLHFLAVSSNYDSFLNKYSPVEGFSQQRSKFSVLLLRAYIGNLLKNTR